MPSKRRAFLPVETWAIWPKHAAPRAWTQPKPLDPVVLGTVSAPIDDDTMADACILLAVIAKTKPHRVAEFFGLQGNRHEKMAFLLRHGHFEQPRRKQ